MPTKQYDARTLYRNGTIIQVPGHPALRICDKVTGAKNNFCIPKATELKEKFDKKRAVEAVTIKISEACELTFNKKNTNAGSNVNNVKGAYFCTVEDVELWIHDSTRPTEFTPVFLAFDQQKKNDNSKYNTRLALDEDYNKIGLPQKKVINLQRCQTDWLSMVKLSSEFDGCLPGEKCLGDSIYSEWPSIIESGVLLSWEWGVIEFLRKYPDRPVLMSDVDVDWLADLRRPTDPLELLHDWPIKSACKCLRGLDVKNIDVTTLTTDYLHYAYPSKEYLLFEDNSYTRAFLHGRVTLEESWLNKWKKSPAAQCKCQMCKVVKELELDENTSHINLFVDKGTHEKGHGYKLNAYDARKRKEKEHESGAAKKKQKTLMPLFGGKPHVLYHAAPDVITSDRRGQQWKMAFRQAEAETRTFLPEYNGPPSPKRGISVRWGPKGLGEIIPRMAN